MSIQPHTLTLHIGETILINEGMPQGYTSPNPWYIESIEHDEDGSYLHARHAIHPERTLNLIILQED